MSSSESTTAVLHSLGLAGKSTSKLGVSFGSRCAIRNDESFSESHAAYYLGAYVMTRLDRTCRVEFRTGWPCSLFKSCKDITCKIQSNS